MEITKQVKQKQRIFNTLTQEEIFRSLISADHCTLGLLFPKGPDILDAVRTLRNISSCRKHCCQNLKPTLKHKDYLHSIKQIAGTVSLGLVRAELLRGST